MVALLSASSGSVFPCAKGNVPYLREFHTQVISVYPFGYASNFVIVIYLLSTVSELSFVHCVGKTRRA